MKKKKLSEIIAKSVHLRMTLIKIRWRGASEAPWTFQIEYSNEMQTFWFYTI